MAEQLSGGREATAEAPGREEEGSLLAEGRKAYGWILSSLPGLSCLPSPRKEDSEPSCAGRGKQGPPLKPPYSWPRGRGVLGLAQDRDWPGLWRRRRNGRG